MAAATEEFTITDAVRVAQSVSIGIMGPSGCGKTKSALRLAKGIQSVTGGDIYVIDTEARRALDYADEFKFKHVDFAPPFGSDRYLAAIEKCRADGAKIIIVDSLSHEHESEGGLLEQHEAELQRLAGDDYAKRERMNAAAWIKPKAKRRQLIVRMEQMRGVNFILTFRAKSTTKPVRNPTTGKTEYVHMGFMPIGGDDFVFGTKATALLLAGADGVPTWNPEHVGEKLMRKLPSYLKSILDDGKALSEDHGRKIAEWARGSSQASSAPVASDLTARVNTVKAKLRAADHTDDLERVWKLAAKLRSEVDPKTREDLDLSYEARLCELTQ